MLVISSHKLRSRATLTVNQRHAWTVRASFANTVEVTVKKLVATNLQALLDNLGSELVHAVLCRETEHVVDGTSTVRRVAVLADVLDAPIAELAVSDDIDAGENFVDAGTLLVMLAECTHRIETRTTMYLVFLKTVLKDVLHY